MIAKLLSIMVLGFFLGSTEGCCASSSKQDFQLKVYLSLPQIGQLNTDDSYRIAWNVCGYKKKLTIEEDTMFDNSSHKSLATYNWVKEDLVPYEVALSSFGAPLNQEGAQKETTDLYGVTKRVATFTDTERCAPELVTTSITITSKFLLEHDINPESEGGQRLLGKTATKSSEQKRCWTRHDAPAHFIEGDPFVGFEMGWNFDWRNVIQKFSKGVDTCGRKLHYLFSCA